MTIARVREREVESKIFISDGEIDNYLASASGLGSAGKSISLRIFCCVHRVGESGTDPEAACQGRPGP